MEIYLEKANDQVGIVKIVGRVDSSSEAKLKKEFLNYLQEYKNFVFDCSELEFIDSSGLGALLSCLKNATKENGDLYIANLQPKPRMLFEITRAYKVFDVFDDLDAAIASFA
ncbi:MAG: STAS domain-containing protein [Candidatus Cloacimonadales bacterium]